MRCFYLYIDFEDSVYPIKFFERGQRWYVKYRGCSYTTEKLFKTSSEGLPLELKKVKKTLVSYFCETLEVIGDLGGADVSSETYSSSRK